MESPNSSICSICWQRLHSDQYTTNCGHNFCRNCICQWVNDCQNNTCPTCRREILINPIPKENIKKINIDTTHSEVHMNILGKKINIKTMDLFKILIK